MMIKLIKISVIAHILILLSMCSVNAIDIVQNDNKIALTDEGYTQNEVVRIVVFDSNGSVAYINEVNASDGGIIEDEFKLSIPKEDIQTTYKLFVNGSNETEITLLSSSEIVNELKGSASAFTVLTEYAERFGIDEGLLGKIKDQTQFNTIFKSEKINAISKVNTACLRAFGIELINEGGRSVALNVLEEYSSVLNVDYINEISKLGASKKETFVLSLVSDKYTSYDQFVSGYKKALNKTNESSTKTGGGSSGGTSGGGGATIVGSPIEKTGELLVDKALFLDLLSVFDINDREELASQLVILAKEMIK